MAEGSTYNNLLADKTSRGRRPGDVVLPPTSGLKIAEVDVGYG
jgi:hypothetical protein